MKNNLDLSLYLVTDSTYHTEESLLYTVEEACKGGVTMVQLREKNTGGRDYLEKACRLRAITDRYHIPLIIDDRVDVAMACGAAGVHVGASDLPVVFSDRIKLWEQPRKPLKLRRRLTRMVQITLESERFTRPQPR